MNSTERGQLINSTQKQVLNNEEMRFNETSSFLDELTKCIDEAFVVINQEAMELASRVEFDEDLGLQYRVEWLKELKNNLGNTVSELFDTITNSSMEHFINTYQSEFIDTGKLFGINTSFTMPPITAIIEAINYPWSGKMWSDRVWTNTQALNNEINRLITRGLMTGESNQAIAKLISKDLVIEREKFKYVTERLIRTENARVQYIADVKCWKELGVEEVEFMAFLDHKTSDFCRSHNTKRYKLGKEPQLPAHPHCRSCYVPVINEDVDWMERLREAKERVQNNKPVKVEEIPDKPVKSEKPVKVKPYVYTEKATVRKNSKGEHVLTVRNTKFYIEEHEKEYIKQYNKIGSRKEFDEFVKGLKEKVISSDFMDFLDKVTYIHNKRDQLLIPDGYTVALTKGDVSALEKKLHEKGFLDKLSNQQKQAINKYTGSAYREINGFLRGLRNASDIIKEITIPKLTEGLSQGKLNMNTILFRGADIDMFTDDFVDRLMGNPQSVVGEVFKDKGFMSTSIASNSAFDKNISLQILAPKGTEGVYVKEFSQFKHENEFLLQKGTELKIVKVEMGRDDLHYTMVCEVVGQNK